jgi:phage terminase small subunit
MALKRERGLKSKAQLRYELFAKEYVLDLNGTRAAIAAGYSKKTAEITASKLLRKAKVQELIQGLIEERAKRLDLNADRILGELCRMGFANMLDYVSVQNGSVYVDLSKMTREQAAAVQEITVDEYTEGRGEQAREVKRTRFKLTDKRGSLELLGRYLKLFTDRVENTGKNGGPMEFKVIIEEVGA